MNLSDNGVLRMEVHDDGAGFDGATVSAGAGFLNMRDRLAAVDGELVTHSRPGRGTRVIVTHSRPGRGTRVIVTIPLEAEG